MTREMNKPDWCNYSKLCGWFGCNVSHCRESKCVHYQRKLDDWIKPFMDSVNERFKQCG
jgi:hypothetical protein